MAREGSQMSIERINELRDASGRVFSADPLVSFLYTLIRNGCPVGVVEEALHETTSESTLYTNGWLAKYAENAAVCLRGRAGL